MRVTEKHVFFFSKNDYLSNWHLAPFDCKGIHFYQTEQFMMYCKAMLFADKAIADRILSATDPKEHKALGREVKGFHQATWEAKCDGFVYVGNREKYFQNQSLLIRLLGTGDRTLVEASPYDSIWGIGMSATAPGVDDPANWKGTNRLGAVLTRLRDDIALERIPLPEPVKRQRDFHSRLHAEPTLAPARMESTLSPS